MIWCSSVFSDTVIHNESFAITIKFQSLQMNKEFFLSNVYGPCDGPRRDDFVAWFESLNIELDVLWLFVGDFNFIRSVDNRNRLGGSIEDMAKFNDIIGKLALL